MRATFMTRLSTYIMGKEEDLISVKSLRLGIDLNWNIILWGQLKCSALYFRCGKMHYFEMLKFFKIHDFEKIYSRLNKKSVRNLRKKNLTGKDWELHILKSEFLWNNIQLPASNYQVYLRFSANNQKKK